MSSHSPLRVVPLAAALLLCLSSAEPAFGQVDLTVIGPNGKLLR